MEPIDYTKGFADPFAGALQGFQLGQQMQTQALNRELVQKQMQAQEALQAQALQKAQAEQQAAQRKAQFQQSVASLMVKPNATHADRVALIEAYPDMLDDVTKAWDKVDAPEQERLTSTLSGIYSALNGGNNDIAAKLVKQEVERAKNSGDPTRIQQAEGFNQMLNSPTGLNALKLSVAMTLGPRLGKDFASAGQTLAKVQTELSKEQAEIDNIRSQIQDRTARFGLAQDQFNLEYETKLEELKQKGGGITLSSGMEKTQSEAVAQSISASTLSNTAASLADAIQKEGRWGGLTSWMGEKAKEVAGFDGGVSELRREFIRIRNQGVLDGLPPGPATDKDIATIKAGFPPDSASSETVSKWLKSFSNVKKAESQMNDAKAEWISQFGSMRNAPSDAEIMGKRIPAGMSFTQFVRKGLSTTAAPASSTPSYLRHGQ